MLQDGEQPSHHACDTQRWLSQLCRQHAARPLAGAPHKPSPVMFVCVSPGSWHRPSPEPTEVLQQCSAEADREPWMNAWCARP